MAAVLANPDEDAPRLVLADWLSDVGDPRGTFIADQIRLARLGEAHPDWSSCYARSERLRVAHEPTWSAPLAQYFPSREVWQATERRFRRGFLEHVESPYPPVSWEFLEGIAGVAPLRSIAWRPPGEAPDQVAQALQLAADAGLRGVTMLFSGSLGPAVFDAVTVDIMRRFDAFGVRSATVSAAAVARLTRLLTPRLRALALDHTIIGDEGLAPLAGSGLLATVEQLDLRGNKLGREGIAHLVSKSSDVPLDLSLADNPSAAPHLGAVLRWRPLRRLDLVGSVDQPAIDRLLTSPRLAELRQLALAPLLPWHFDEMRASALAAVPFQQLTRLAIGRCRVTPRGMAALAGSPHLARLVDFEAYDSWIKDAGVEALVHSESLTRLVRLDLNGNELTDRALELLAGWEGLEHVVHLKLGQNYDITERGWRALIAADRFRPASLGVTQHLRTANPRLWRALIERFGEGVVHHDGLRWPMPYPSPYSMLD